MKLVAMMFAFVFHACPFCASDSCNAVTCHKRTGIPHNFVCFTCMRPRPRNPNELEASTNTCPNSRSGGCRAPALADTHVFCKRCLLPLQGTTIETVFSRLRLYAGHAVESASRVALNRPCFKKNACVDLRIKTLIWNLFVNHRDLLPRDDWNMVYTRGVFDMLSFWNKAAANSFKTMRTLQFLVSVATAARTLEPVKKYFEKNE